MAIKHPLSPLLEPNCVSQAIKDPNWRTVMSDEFNALLQNGTWELVPSTCNQNMVRYKWVFCVKQNLDGTITRYKTILIAQGFH